MNGQYGAVMGPADMKLEPADIKQEMDPDSTTGNSPKKKAGRPKKLKQEKITEHVTVKKRKVDRFKGMSEEEVVKRLLPDHLAPNLDIVIVGINPGLYAAFVGHHYAGPGNHFWKCMYLSGLIPEPMNAMQDFKLLEYGIGFTNIVARTTRGSADLTRKEIKEGAQILTEKLIKYKPKIAVFNGKGIYEVFVGHKNFHFGKQPEKLPGTETAVYVMPSSSARCSQLPRAIDKVPFYDALRKFRDHLNGKLPDLEECEITFPDIALKTAVKKEPKEENSEQYPGETDPSQLGQFTEGSYQFIPHQVSGSVSTSSDFLPCSSGSISSGAGSFPIAGQAGPVQVKQEPFDPKCLATSSQSETMSLGQIEVYNQSAGPAHGDSHLNNFLHGLYGMVDQVAGGSHSLSKYGMVNEAGISKVQFNDALRDIVKDCTADQETDPPGLGQAQMAVSPPTQATGKSGGKGGKQRKRNSKSKGESCGQSKSVVDPTGQSQNQHLMSSSAAATTSPQSSFPLQVSGLTTMQGSFPPFTSNVHYSNYPVTTHNMVYSNPQYIAPMPTQFTQSGHFPHAMPNSYPDTPMGMSGQNGAMSGFPYPMVTTSGSSVGMDSQLFTGLDPKVTVKQEQPDH